MLVNAHYNERPYPTQPNIMIYGLDQATKIQYLKQGIRAEANLEISLSLARTVATNYKTLEDFLAFLKADCWNRQKESKFGCQVSALKSDKKSKSQYSKNHNLERWPIIKRTVDGKIIEEWGYPVNENRKLTNVQQLAVKDLQQEKKQRENKRSMKQVSVD